MKYLFKLSLAFFLVCIIPVKAIAQTSDLIKQGVELHNQGKYAEAIDKFTEALKADPDNAYANYEMAFSLYAAKKPKDALPYLEKATKSTNIQLSVPAYSLLASIYDEDNQPKKAIEIYQQAIKIDAAYPQLYYNLGICYSRNQQYPEAESAAIEAIKHDPQKASNQRLYALVTFHQNKRVNALMAFCSFLLLEPSGARAAEAYGNLQHILQGGVLKDNNGNTNLSVSTTPDKETNALNLGISMATISGQSKKLTGTDLLEYQLKTIFMLAGELSAKKADKSFFDNYFVAYFYKLAQSPNMPALAHTVALTDTKQGNAAWVKQNQESVSALADWVKGTERTF